MEGHAFLLPSDSVPRGSCAVFYRQPSSTPCSMQCKHKVIHLKHIYRMIVPKLTVSIVKDYVIKLDGFMKISVQNPVPSGELGGFHSR